ncbi:hypothetical protein Q9L58_002297 [Maublancomyces gigas]|uniref:Uncharacterized protein n=1 Tax=Discina gigas TaxID=1032678 RepID=A0ABR3GS15_9PEZI
MSALRLSIVIRHGALQQWRTLFGLLELLAACCVTNGPIFYRLVMNNIETRNASRAKGGSTGGSSGVGSSDAPQRIQRAADDLELGDLHDFTDEENLPTKCSTADIRVWEAQEFHSQECLKVN